MNSLTPICPALSPDQHLYAACFSFYFSSLRISPLWALPIFVFVVSLPKITLPLCRSYHLSLTQEPLGLPLLFFFHTVYFKDLPTMLQLHSSASPTTSKGRDYVASFFLLSAVLYCLIHNGSSVNVC